MMIFAEFEMFMELFMEMQLLNCNKDNFIFIPQMLILFDDVII